MPWCGQKQRRSAFLCRQPPAFDRLLPVSRAMWRCASRSEVRICPKITCNQRNVGLVILGEPRRKRACRQSGVSGGRISPNVIHEHRGGNNIHSRLNLRATGTGVRRFGTQSQNISGEP